MSAPGATSTPALAVRPWGLGSAEERELLSALRFRHFKWDTFAGGGPTLIPECLVVSESLHQEVVHTVEALHGALCRFEARVQDQPEALARLGIPPALHPWIRADRRPGGQGDTGGGPTALQCARYDLFPTEDGRLMVSEFNEDVPGGFNECEALPELLGDPGHGLRWEAGLRRRVEDAFRPFPSVAFLYATAFSEDLQHMLILERWLARAGHRTVLGSPEHLRKGLRRPKVLGTPLDAVFRFYPGEWMPLLPNFATWLRVGPRLPMMNPIRHMVRQSKLAFALWGEDPELDAEDRALLERHCPRTWFFDPAEVPRLRDERERWVLKRAFGRMGDAVTLGRLVTPKEWDQALARASKRPGDWCVQECFSVRTVEFGCGPLYPALGAFVVNGRFAGYYSRAARRPFLTHEAYHVGTLVRADRPVP